MNERKVKRLAYEKPYLFDNAYLLSRSEAQRLMSKYGYPSLTRVVALAQRKGILGEDACSEIDRMVERYEKRTGFAVWLRKAGRETVNGIRRHKRLAIIALVVLLLAGFFGLTPTGRAIAEDIRRVIVSLFEDGFSVEVKPSEDNVNTVIAHDVIEYSTIDDFKRETGLTAAYIESDELYLRRIKRYNHRNEIVLSTIYETSDGGTVEIQQTWTENSGYYVGTSYGNIIWEEYVSPSNIRFNYFVNEEDGRFYALTTTVDTVIYLTSDVPQYIVLLLDSVRIPSN